MKTYFAYGSNLNESRFKNRVSSAQFKERATLHGHRLVFEKLSTSDGSAKATIIPDESSSVEGVIYSYADEHHVDLKRCERGYSETEVSLATQAGEVSAQTFVAETRTQGIRPFDWYVQHIISGGQKFGLPKDYLTKLENVPTDRDDNAERVVKERTFLQ